MIHISLSPNTESDDLCLCFRSLFKPWNWKKAGDVAVLEKVFKEYLGIASAVSFQRGRDALYVLLKALGIGVGDEVIIQAYTCVVVPNAIQYVGAKPVYVDIEENGFNIDPVLVEKAITPKTKAIIVQHTFGEPADLDAVKLICDRHQLLLIEDCALSLSARYKGKLVGTFGDAAFWSFGRDKVISSVWGGMVTTNNAELAKKLRFFQAALSNPTFFQIFQALFHPLIFAIAKPVYHCGLGKFLIRLAQVLKLIPKVIYPMEKHGKQPKWIPQKMPNVLARIALQQFQKLNRFHEHRKKIAAQYEKAFQNVLKLQLPISQHDSAWLRYTIRSPDAKKMLQQAKLEGMYLGDWYRTIVAPSDILPSDFGYKTGSCPRAEKAAEESFNLPTHIQMNEEKVQELIDKIKKIV